MGNPAETSEQAFLAAYDPKAYTPVAVTVDVAAFTLRAGSLQVLLVKRANHPFKDVWCLPGGFIKPGPDGAFPDLAAAAQGRLLAETGVSIDAGAPDSLERVHLEQLGAYGGPGRDPRMHVISVAYIALSPGLPEPRAGEGATEAAWVPVDEAGERKLAFDHDRILADATARTRGRLEYSPVATAFLPAEFTIRDLQDVYETVWGHGLTASDFRRKVLSTRGFVEPTGGTTDRGGRGGGRRAQLFRAGDCQLLHPPILSDTSKVVIR